MRRLRVAMVAFDFGEYCLALANALARDADLLLLLPRSESALAPPAEPPLQVVTYAKPRLRQPGRQLVTCLRLVRAVRSHDPDVVHLQQGHLWFNLALRLLPRRPLVVTAHDLRPHPGDRGGQRTPAPLMRLAFRRADRLVVHGERMREEAVAAGLVAPAAVDVVPHVALADGAPADSEAGPCVLFFGRIWPYKGLEHLIAAEPAIAAVVPDVRIVIAGQGEPLERYRRRMRDPERFEVHEGFVPAGDRARLFARASVVALPYVEASGSGVLALAQAHGKPVVASAVGGLADAVEDGGTGLLVPPGDPDALAAAVVRLLRDEPLRRRLGTAGRGVAESASSPRAVAARTLASYRRAVRQASEVPREECLRAAVALHDHLLERHWNASVLTGPDCGVRLNYRAGRFVKSYLRALPLRDDLVYLQAQGYWALANAALAAATGDARYRALAAASAEGMVARQRADGAWEYPQGGWHGRVAAAEGCWAAIGLVAVHRLTGDEAALAGALRFARFLERSIGYQAALGGLAANYFAGRSGAAVPNTTAFVLRLLAELADVTADRRHLVSAPALLAFLGAAQRPDGELPYEVQTAQGAPRLVHFQCFQYAAFQALDLLRVHELTGADEAALVARGLLRFLRRGLQADGSPRYACDRPSPRVTYHGTAIAAALAAGARAGLAGPDAGAARAYRRALRLQRARGSFPHSRRDYRLLRDERSYPRHQAMLLQHLLVGAGIDRESAGLRGAA